MQVEAVLIRMDDGSSVAGLLDRAAGQLDAAAGELALDFSMVRRLDSAGVQALERLVKVAEEKSVRITVLGISPGVYKVLKLMKLAARLSFSN